MSLRIDSTLTPKKLVPKINRLFDLSAQKILAIQKRWRPERGTPVFTIKGEYTSRGWTEWTQGFQYGSALLQFDATSDATFLVLGRELTVDHMAKHVSHVGVHDHGFNNVSTYGNLLRLMQSDRIVFDPFEKDFCELALKVSGAIQAARWTPTALGGGFIYSFNGPQSLFIDTMRSLRSLAIAHQLGHVLMGEGDRRICLLGRLLDHAATTAKYSVYYGEGRDAYDVRGRVAHECIFNVNDGQFRCPNSQQGFSPFTTWTRGLAWALCGFAEQLEFIQTLPTSDLKKWGGHKKILEMLLKPALACADFYLENVPTCGVPYWDTGAPNLQRIRNYLDRPADPYNDWEPVDSSAAVIASQGFLRLSRFLSNARLGLLPSSVRARAKSLAREYSGAGLTIAGTVFDEPYLSTDPRHEGLILHSVYHRPNGWDHIAKRQLVPNGESSMWGDYHARELALVILRWAHGEPWPDFYGCLPRTKVAR